MKNRVEYRGLLAIGATPAQLETYSNTDPLTITEENGLYSISGVIEADNLTPADVLSYLDALGADE